MPIPERQLETWSHPGAAGQSRDTYGSVKGALEDRSSPYADKSFDAFLQGSYGNDTNVYRDSDVDVVLRLDSTFAHDAHTLVAEQQTAFHREYASATYTYDQFKTDVYFWLRRKYGDTVRLGKKAIFIPGNGARRDCDVLPALAYRYYYSFKGVGDQNFAQGICFYLPDGSQIVNFPKQHSSNCTTKHQATSNRFKPNVRVFKNMRNHLVDTGRLQDGVASSCFIEGLLYNAPNEKFLPSYGDTFVELFNFFVPADKSDWRCANGIHYLLRDNSHMSWAPANCERFLNELQTLWNSWK